MTKYNEELTQAGILLAADGLHPTAKGARVSFPGGKSTVTDGPFAEAKEMIGGYWIIQARSKEEAVEWASRCPGADGDVIEVRRIYEMSDFSEDVQAAAGELSRTPPEQPAAQVGLVGRADATAGDDWMRPELCEEALRLGRVLTGLMPKEPEVHGLVALVEIRASRARGRARRASPSCCPTRTAGAGTGCWSAAARGAGARRSLGGAAGTYVLQAAIAACHARAHTADETDWPRMAALYGALAAAAPSPVVELNRAVAIGMALGPAAGLEHVDRIAGEPSLRDYHLLPSVRGDLLARLGRDGEARAEFERAAALTGTSANARCCSRAQARAREARGRPRRAPQCRRYARPDRGVERRARAPFRRSPSPPYSCLS